VSDNNKKQARNNRIINKYDLNYIFIKSYDNIEDIKTYLNIKDPKYVTLCASKNKKQKTYKKFIFRYDDIDEFKYNFNEINLMNKEDININHIEETKQTLEEYENNLMIQEDININIYNFNIKDEIWKKIDESDYNIENMNMNNPTLYYISNFGRYKSERRVMNKRSKLFGTYKMEIGTLHLAAGYNYCHLTGKKPNGEKKIIKLRINLLVAKYFLIFPERLENIPKSKIDVDHKDHNKLNNHYSNLQYVTKSENHSKEYLE
jgi:hypothetical protein